LSATSLKVGHGFRLALPTGAYYTWNGTALEGSPIEPDVVSEFDWQDRRRGSDRQLAAATEDRRRRNINVIVFVRVARRYFGECIGFVIVS
jgi:C-terminal processing protease CtpA/Prc